MHNLSKPLMVKSVVFLHQKRKTMEPITNEPKGWEENRQNNQTDFGDLTDKEDTNLVNDDLGGDLAGNASGNVPEEEQEDVEDESATDDIADDDPRGFLGDFAEPQHDDDY